MLHLFFVALGSDSQSFLPKKMWSRRPTIMIASDPTRTPL